MEQVKLPIKTKIAAWWMIVIAWVTFFVFLLALAFLFLGSLSGHSSPDDFLVLVLLIIFLASRRYGYQILKGKKQAWTIAIVTLLIPIFLIFGAAIFQLMRSNLAIMIYYSFYIIPLLIPLILLLVDRKNFWKIAS